MRIIKKMDQYLLKAYLQLFAGTFFICLFIFLMQFTWRYVNELIGKGLSTEVLGKFFWYASLNLVPMSLPLAILLAALISFGNMGEKLELLSMKAAGVSLIRILAPIFCFVVMLSFGSFYFQNNVGPEATKQLAALIYSIKQKSPELEIPEGIFYNEIPGFNIFVERKDRDTGMLYGVMIYRNTSGSDDTQIVLADSGRLQSTADHMHLKLTLYGGERFQNMAQNGGQMLKANMPYMRETFDIEEDLVEFADTFNVTDGSFFAANAATKNLEAINHGIDSLKERLSYLGHTIYNSYSSTQLKRSLSPGRKDSLEIVKNAYKVASLDTLKKNLDGAQRQDTWKLARNNTQQLVNECEFRAMANNLDETNRTYRLHWVEWHKKFTLSVACLIFFFIGAPLGAIIRKGGLGLPVVVSVLIFIFYYIINVSGEKMAKTGDWEISFGIWLSSMVLAPIGAFLTYKANNDSAMFDMDGYRKFFRRLLGLRTSRKLRKKDIIIVDPDYKRLIPQLQQIVNESKDYFHSHHLLRTPSYFKTFFHYSDDTQVKDICSRLEEAIEELQNTQDTKIINHLNMIPILSPTAHTRPFHSMRKNMIIGILFPIGLCFFFRIWRYRIRLRNDLQLVQKHLKAIIKRAISLYAPELEGIETTIQPEASAPVEKAETPDTEEIQEEQTTADMLEDTENEENPAPSNEQEL